MTVSDFIAWLQTQEQGATVQVLVEERHGQYGYEPYTSTGWVDFDPEHHANQLSLPGNTNLHGSRWLELGATA